MNNIEGIRISNAHDAGSLTIYDFVLIEGMVDIGIESILSNLEDGHKVVFSDPVRGECYREIRVSSGQYEKKIGCHGCFGTWETTTKQDAVKWIKEVSEYNISDRYGQASYSIEKK